MRALRSNWIYSLIILITIAFNVQSQVSSFKHFGLDKSIFPSRIECISQAESGELLVGTLAGLVVYDGYTFRTMGLADGLAESSISSVFVSGDEVLLGHWAGNISRYFLEKDSIAQLSISSDLNFSSVKQMLKMNDGSILILTAEGKVYTYLNGNIERVLLPLRFDNEKVLQFSQKGSQLTLVLESQLLEADSKLKNLDWNEVYSTDVLSFTSACQVSDQLWLLGTEDGAYGLSVANGVQPQPRSFEETKGKSIQSFEKREQDEFWIATKDAGVLVLEVSSGSARSFNRENGLSYNQVRDVFVDREKTAWIGTTAGLDQYLGDAFMLYDHRGSLNGSLVWDILKVHDHIYALTLKGVEKYPLSPDGRLLKLKVSVDFNDEEPRQIIFNGDDLLYVLGSEGGLWRGSFSTDQFVKLNDLPFDAQCMEFVGSSLWVGTDEGVYILDDDKPLEHLTAEIGLGGNRVTGIYHSTQSNETWITALGGEATLYSEGKFKKYGRQQGLTSSVLQDAAFDLEGNIWFASYDKGVFYKEGDAFKALNDSVKLTSPTTFAIAVDKKGVVWIGHNWGVDRYDHANKTLDWFGEDEGFMGVEVNSGSIIIDESSTLWLGTLMGVLRFDPSRIVENEVACLLDIVRASLGAQNLLGTNQSSFELSSSNDLMVRFKGISLQNPSKNKFMYRLKGAHENWRTLSSNQPIEYLSLPVGDFQFELKAFNDSGVCSQSPATFEFSIKPPFYKTWWFYTIIFLLVILLVVFMDRYRVVNLLEKNRALEEKLSIKDQELIEIDEERVMASSALKSELSIIKGLEQRDKDRSQLETEMFNHFASFSEHQSDIGSHGIIAISCKDYRFVLFTDVHVQGISAHALRANLKATIWDHIPREFKPDEISNEVAIAIASLEKTFGKFKGINWLLSLDNFSERVFYKSNMSVFTFSHGVVEEVGNEYASSDKNGFKLPSTAPMFVCSASLFEQLNESGTKLYSKARIVEILKQKQSEPQKSIAKELLTDLKNWRGAMEQFNDVEFYFWNHE